MTTDTPRLVLHPETGREVHSHQEFLEAIDWVEKRLAPLYKVRRHLREAMAERYPAPELPEPRHRTDAQARVARCPRCGGRLETETAP